MNFNLNLMKSNNVTKGCLFRSAEIGLCRHRPRGFFLDYRNASFKEFKWEKSRKPGGKLFLSMKHSLERYSNI